MDIKEFISERVIGENGATPVYVTISGSHLYGFNSPDSDVDYRGCYQIPTVAYLTLDHPPQHIKETENSDIVLYELKKECELILAGNCNVLEHLLAKPILTSTIHRELRDLTKSNLNFNGLYNSYRGMADFNLNKYIKSGKKVTAKKYLYVLRGLMAGIHVLTTDIIEPNLNTLNRWLNYGIIDGLINIKTTLGEDVEIKSEFIIKESEEVIDELFGVIDSVWDRRKNKNRNDELRKSINTWLEKRRREML